MVPTIASAQDYLSMGSSGQKKIFARVIRAANKDQKKIVDFYNKRNKKK
ncbi:hypothetical protein K9M41_03030 [Candidatus Gracilibacteria bacterium]|nr:hypothetical protein [Candidatus Gracilibacteria bacterium]